MAYLLVVDDEPNVLYSVKKGLETDELRVLTSETATGGLRILREGDIDAVILDVRLPDMSGLDAFEQIQAIDRRVPVIMITAFTTTATAIEAMRRGAFEYLLKPVEFRQLRDVVQKALEVSRLSRAPALIAPSESEDASKSDQSADLIVGQSRAMQDVYKAIGRVALQDVSVLIVGESGTGKELVARAIYQYSKRSRGPFVAINCAAIPEPLLEAELFGHEKGAFTGADRRRMGKFEYANGGTVFLDEVGDMPPATQAKLLRLLQERCFERLGGNELIETDVRVLAATNRDVDDLVASGAFRNDLLYRLNGFTIDLPPLRQRADDLLLLTEHFLHRFGRELGREVHAVSPDAIELLRNYEWPGNVRELQSAIRYALVHATNAVVTADCFPDKISIRLEPAAAGPTAETTSGDAPPVAGIDLEQMARGLLDSGRPEIYYEVHSLVDRFLLPKVLERCKGSQKSAADVLGITRSTLRSKLAALGITVEKRAIAETEQHGQTSPTRAV